MVDARMGHIIKVVNQPFEIKILNQNTRVFFSRKKIANGVQDVQYLLYCYLFQQDKG